MADHQEDLAREHLAAMATDRSEEQLDLVEPQIQVGLGKLHRELVELDAAGLPAKDVVVAAVVVVDHQACEIDPEWKKDRVVLAKHLHQEQPEVPWHQLAVAAYEVAVVHLAADVVVGEEEA